MNANVQQVFGSSYVSGNPAVGDLNLTVLLNAAGVNAFRGGNRPFIRSIVKKILVEEGKIAHAQKNWEGHDFDPDVVDCNVIALRGWEYVLNIVLSHEMLAALHDPDHDEHFLAHEMLSGRIIKAANNLDLRLPLPVIEVPSMESAPAPVEAPPVAEIEETVPVAEKPKRKRVRKSTAQDAPMQIIAPEEALIEG